MPPAKRRGDNGDTARQGTLRPAYRARPARAGRRRRSSIGRSGSEAASRHRERAYDRKSRSLLACGTAYPAMSARSGIARPAHPRFTVNTAIAMVSGRSGSALCCQTDPPAHGGEPESRARETLPKSSSLRSGFRGDDWRQAQQMPAAHSISAERRHIVGGG